MTADPAFDVTDISALVDSDMARSFYLGLCPLQEQGFFEMETNFPRQSIPHIFGVLDQLLQLDHRTILTSYWLTNRIAWRRIIRRSS